jgi:hypothetical protein
MKSLASRLVLSIVICLNSIAFWAQPDPGVYMGTQPDDPNRVHEVKVNGAYFIYTEYSTAPEFIRTRGGFYTADADSLNVELEFNSAYEQDSVRSISFGYLKNGEQLVLNEGNPITLQRLSDQKQDLDGAWLFATRGPDTGQERRGDETPRKTLKFLMDGYFQWIAYHTETMRFSGTGGGTFTSRDGVYAETIQFFSRDNSRVGAVLEFNYERKGDDWHHTGNNSKGEPMYEIWSLRK